MGLLDGKTAIVTGGSRGIGRAIVDAFASEGASVAFTYLSSREKAEALAGEWQAKGRNVIACYSDASNRIGQTPTAPGTLLGSSAAFHASNPPTRFAMSRNPARRRMLVAIELL